MPTSSDRRRQASALLAAALAGRQAGDRLAKRLGHGGELGQVAERVELHAVGQKQRIGHPVGHPMLALQRIGQGVHDVGPGVADSDAGVHAGLGHAVARGQVAAVRHGGAQMGPDQPDRLQGIEIGHGRGVLRGVGLHGVAQGVHPRGRRHRGRDRQGEQRVHDGHVGDGERAHHGLLVPGGRDVEEGVRRDLGPRAGGAGYQDRGNPPLLHQPDPEIVLQRPFVSHQHRHRLGGVERGPAAQADHQICA